MDIEKCRSIIKHNLREKRTLEHIISTFYEKCDLQFGERLSFDSWNVVGLVAKKLNTISLFIPMKDRELGAMCYYQQHSYSYVFINSSIPESNMRFAFCHELYHLLNPREMMNKGLDMYLDEEYLASNDEMLANAFAGAVLMPEQRLMNQWNGLHNLGDIEKIVRLSEIFGAPYISVVIRCFELELFHDFSKLENLLGVNKLQLAHMYDDFWLNDTLLEPQRIDQFNKLHRLLGIKAQEQIENDELSIYDKEYIFGKIQQLYEKIKG